jgi:hypothetical protein
MDRICHIARWQLISPRTSDLVPCNQPSCTGIVRIELDDLLSFNRQLTTRPYPRVLRAAATSHVAPTAHHVKTSERTIMCGLLHELWPSFFPSGAAAQKSLTAIVAIVLLIHVLDEDPMNCKTLERTLSIACR